MGISLLSGVLYSLFNSKFGEGPSRAVHRTFVPYVDPQRKHSLGADAEIGGKLAALCAGSDSRG